MAPVTSSSTAYAVRGMWARSTRSAKTADMASRGLRAALRPRGVPLVWEDSTDSMSELTSGSRDGDRGDVEAGAAGGMDAVAGSEENDGASGAAWAGATGVGAGAGAATGGMLAGPGLLTGAGGAAGAWAAAADGAARAAVGSRICGAGATWEAA